MQIGAAMMASLLHCLQGCANVASAIAVSMLSMHLEGSAWSESKENFVSFAT